MSQEPLRMSLVFQLVRHMSVVILHGEEPIKSLGFLTRAHLNTRTISCTPPGQAYHGVQAGVEKKDVVLHGEPDHPLLPPRGGVSLCVCYTV